MFEPEKKDVSSTGSGSESKSEEIESERQRLQILTGVLVGIVKTKKREIDCLCCQEVDALIGIFQNEQVKCAIMCEEFKAFCLNKVVLKNVLTGLHKTTEYCERLGIRYGH